MTRFMGVKAREANQKLTSAPSTSTSGEMTSNAVPTVESEVFTNDSVVPTCTTPKIFPSWVKARL